MSEAIITTETAENNDVEMTIVSTSCDKECHHLHEFPEGLRVLLIDDNIICLTVVTALSETATIKV